MVKWVCKNMSKGKRILSEFVISTEKCVINHSTSQVVFYTFLHAGKLYFCDEGG